MGKLLLRIFVPLLISALALWLATRNVKWDELKILLAQAKFAPFFWGFLVSLVTFWLRALRWQIMLEPFQKISIWPLIRWQTGGILINNLLPLRAGEFARAYWAGHKSSIPKSSILATIVMERILDILFIAAITIILLITMGFVKNNPFLTWKNLGFAAAAGAGLILAARFMLRGKSLDQMARNLSRFFPRKLGEMLEHFISGLHVLKSKKEVFKLCLLSPIVWSVDILVIAITSRSLVLNLSWMQSGLTMGGLILGVMIPAAPGAVGTYEAGGVQALGLMGFDSTLAFSFVALLHVMQMAFILVLGIPSLALEGFNPKKLYREMESSQTP